MENKENNNVAVNKPRERKTREPREKREPRSSTRGMGRREKLAGDKPQTRRPKREYVSRENKKEE